MHATASVTKQTDKSSPMNLRLIRRSRWPGAFSNHARFNDVGPNFRHGLEPFRVERLLTEPSLTRLGSQTAVGRIGHPGDAPHTFAAVSAIVRSFDRSCSNVIWLPRIDVPNPH